MSTNAVLTKTQKRRMKLQAAQDEAAKENAFIDIMINEAKCTNSHVYENQTSKSTGKLKKKLVHGDTSGIFTRADPALLNSVEEMKQNATNNMNGQSPTQTSLDPNQAPNQTPTHELTAPTVLITEDDIVNKADFMWAEVKLAAKSDEKFRAMKDKAKIEFFRTNMGYASFMDDHPIVTRYMICMGQYKSKSFRRYLDRIKQVVHPDASLREKGYMEDQWIRRQADYVQYLWESYQKRHYNNAERKYVWQNTYMNLRGEFNDFRNMHKDIETKVEEEKEVLAAQNARDLLERLKSGTQKLSTDEEAMLLLELQTLIVKRRFQTTLDEMLKKTEVIAASSTGVGHGADDNAPKITMIETVDAERMNEIDDKYKDPKYRGLEAVLGADGRAVSVDQEILIDSTTNYTKLETVHEVTEVETE